ncbi:MAG: glycosyltransferase family 9 protein [Hydrogenobacter sp.]|uniref:glycosyltransferase family 9 protein n=1 Tax=Hydrogenobacter thermophilus TaxID=940 RepID=UPI0030F7469A
MKRILMLMGHSAGIGDLLRGSASWRALKNRFPDAELHLLFLTKDKGAVSEKLISRHHLLSSFHVIDKRLKSLKSLLDFFREFDEIVMKVNPELIIDFEPHGLKSSFLCAYARLKYGIKSVGVGEIPMRKYFYSVASPPSAKVLKGADYTDRYFAVLKALGIERNGIPIELEETQEAVEFRRNFHGRYGIPHDKVLIGLNIGCGTPDALWKRPNIHLLREVVLEIQLRTKSLLILTGASFERDINREFLKDYPLEALDLAGHTDILELPGLLRSLSLFISTDSGPYHMAVALKVPTLALFVKDFPPSYHHHPWVSCKVLSKREDIPHIINEGLRLYDSFCKKEESTK